MVIVYHEHIAVTEYHSAWIIQMKRAVQDLDLVHLVSGLVELMGLVYLFKQDVIIYTTVLITLMKQAVKHVALISGHVGMGLVYPFRKDVITGIIVETFLTKRTAKFVGLMSGPVEIGLVYQTRLYVMAIMTAQIILMRMDVK